MSEENTKEDPGPGRPTTFREAYLEQAYKLCLLKATDADLADFFGVTETTINNWKNDFPDFKDALKRGKDQIDAEVAQSLCNRATGYESTEEKVFMHEGKPITVTVKKIIEPDVTAAKYWLNNRQRQNWKERQDVEHTGSVAHKHEGIPGTIRLLREFRGAGEDQLPPDDVQD